MALGGVRGEWEKWRKRWHPPTLRVPTPPGGEEDEETVGISQGTPAGTRPPRISIAAETFLCCIEDDDDDADDEKSWLMVRAES